MALTGLQIFKLLPKTNCKECGLPTCLAFAMALAGKKASLDQCPHVSDDAKAALDSAAAPPIRLVKIGVGDAEVAIGNETVLFRHEESFYHPTGIAVLVSDKLDEAALNAKLEKIKSWTFERVGMEISVNFTAVVNDTDKTEPFVKAAKAAAEKSGRAVILMSDKVSSLKAAAEAIKDTKPLLYTATPENINDIAAVAKECGCPVVAKSHSMANIGELTAKLNSLGVQDIIIDSGDRQLNDVIDDQTQIRRQALKKGNRGLGYPTISFVEEKDPMLAVVEAGALICKYAGIVVIDADEPWQILPLVTLRQNIFTDPRKPIMVEAKIYTIGAPDENSPVLSTTNFSLTYFTVEGEVEASKVAAWILVSDTEGMSVLTAWAADKYNPENISKAIKENGMETRVNHKKIVIPGFVAVISGELEEESGWKVLVGPREAAGIPAYLKLWTEGKL